METVSDFIFLGSKITADSNCSHEIKRCLLLGRKAMINLGKVLKKQRHHFADKGPYSQSYVFSSSHVQMWELDHTEGWAPKNWCFLIVVLEKTLESPLDCKEMKPVNPKRDQPWIFIGRTDAEAEAPILWPPAVKSWLIRKDPDAGKNWGQEEKGMTEDKTVRWHHKFSRHELEQTPGNSEGQGSLAWCSPQGREELDMTERWNNETKEFLQEENTREGKDLQKINRKSKTIKKMVIGSYILIIMLNVNGLNAPTKRHRLAEKVKVIVDQLCVNDVSALRPHGL